MGVNFYIFRVWAVGRDPLVQIQREWSVTDVIRAIAFLELEAAEQNHQ